MFPAPSNESFSPWQEFYAVLDSSKYIGTVMSTKPLLAGWWEEYPTLSNGYLAVSILQLVISSIGLIGMAILVRQKKNSPEAIFGNFQADNSLRVIYILRPVITLIWQLTLSLIGITLITTWISAASSTFIFIHAWMELTVFLLTVMVVRKPSIYTLSKLKYSLLGIGLGMTLVFMMSGDVYWKAALGGLSLISDLGNFFVAPVAFGLLSKRAWWNSDIAYIEGYSLGMFILHVVTFYPEALVATFAENGVYKAGILILTFSTVNLPLLILYSCSSLLGLYYAKPSELPFAISPL